MACYGLDYKPHQDVVGLFDDVVHAFYMDASIMPLNTTTCQIGDTQNALKTRTGSIPYLGCGNKDTAPGGVVVQLMIVGL